MGFAQAFREACALITSLPGDFTSKKLSTLRELTNWALSAVEYFEPG
jgi:hypothetical protein